METWITFWKIVCIISFGTFILLVLFIIPSGAVGIVQFFKDLSQEKSETNTEESGQEEPKS